MFCRILEYYIQRVFSLGSAEYQSIIYREYFPYVLQNTRVLYIESFFLRFCRILEYYIQIVFSLGSAEYQSIIYREYFPQVLQNTRVLYIESIFLRFCRIQSVQLTETEEKYMLFSEFIYKNMQIGNKRIITT